MATLEEQFNYINNMQLSWEHKEAMKIASIAAHIDNIEATLRYLVDQKVEEKYGK